MVSEFLSAQKELLAQVIIITFFKISLYEVYYIIK